MEMTEIMSEFYANLWIEILSDKNDNFLDAARKYSLKESDLTFSDKCAKSIKLNIIHFH